MWIFTPIGFFSVTQVNRASKSVPEGTLQIRARVKQDLVNLRERYIPELSEPISLPHRDYPYRAYISREALAPVMARMIEDIDYSNFKDQVKANQGKERASLYMDVWSTMYQAERKLEEKKRKTQGFKRMSQSPRTSYLREDLELREEEYLDLEQFYANQASALSELDDANAYQDFNRALENEDLDLHDSLEDLDAEFTKTWKSFPDFEKSKRRSRKKKRKR